MKFGKYEVIKEIGKGAMGVVYLAFDPLIERQVAIKTMNPQLFQDKEQRERFFREAKSAGILQHPNIVTIYDMGMEGDTPYIVMEYVEGKDLDSLIKSKKLDLQTSLKIMEQLCDALHYAHSKGIIHRDIKPSNIRVLPDNTIKIMDFGIAKKRGSDLTQTGVLLGTISYMAPEQLKEGKVSPQSDQFSAGIVFYEMLSGDRCFKGDTITAIMYKIVSFNEQEINLSSVPQNIVAVLKKMVAHNPGNRFSSCAEVRDLLKNIISKPTVQIGEKTKGIIPPPPIPQSKEYTSTVVKPSTPTKKKSFVGIVVFFVVVLLILGGVFYVAHKKHKRKLALLKQQTNTLKKNENMLATVSSNQDKQDKEQVINNVEKNEEMPEKPNTESTKQSDGESPSSTVGFEKKSNVSNGEVSPQVKEKPPLKPSKRRVKKPFREKEVFSYSNNVKKKERHLNFTASQRKMLKRFSERAQRLSFAERKSRAYTFFNSGMTALGNNEYRVAALNFYKSIILNPQRKEPYAFLCIALAKMRAYDDIKKVIKMANKNGITLGDLRQNKMFNAMYTRLKQNGNLD